MREKIKALTFTSWNLIERSMTKHSRISRFDFIRQLALNEENAELYRD